MITALLDNYIYQTRNTCEGLKEIKWKRVLDVNDRSLRNIVSGLGGSANGVPTETGFDITPASEIMAILCLATDIEDLKRRVGNILLGYTNEDKPFTVNDLGIAGAITVLLKTHYCRTLYKQRRILPHLYMEVLSLISPMDVIPYRPPKWLLLMEIM